MVGTVEDIKQILYPGVRGQLSPIQANNLVLQLTIFAADPIDDDSLRLLARFFTPQDYEDLIEERTVTSRCGYPTCHNMLRDASGNIRNPLTRSVVAWQHAFCQLQCYQASDFYRGQLSRESLITRENVAWIPPGEMRYEQEILLLPEALTLAKLQNKSVAQVVAETVRDQKQKQLSESLMSLSMGGDGGSHDSTPAVSSPAVDTAADSIASLAIKENHPTEAPQAP